MKQTKIKAYAATTVLALFLFGFAAAHIFLPDGDISSAERRPLAQFPAVNAKSIANGKFMNDFEKYTLDQFPLRDSFRTMKAFSNNILYHRSDNNGIYIVDGSAVKLEYPLHYDSLDRAAQRFQYVYEKYLKGTRSSVYFSIIPDKNYFAAQKNGYLRMDYDSLINRMKSRMNFARYIDIFDTLSLLDYYQTDAHWRQECIADTAQALADAMGAELTDRFTKTPAGTPFYGVYCGQSALPMEPDKLYYLESGILDRCTVYDFETDRFIPVYDKEKLLSNDPYEIFLSGPKSLLTIDNPEADTQKELILFRDSFASSLAPLLISGYSKITLIDIRYISPDLLDRFVTFKNQDVLFLYSTSVLNNSSTIK